LASISLADNALLTFAALACTAVVACVESPSEAENERPVAAVAVDVADAPVIAFDARASDDPDGSIDEYIFNYGDGTRLEVSASPFGLHTYAAPGFYNVELSVVDDRGAKESLTLSIEVPSWPGAPDPIDARDGGLPDGGASDAGTDDVEDDDGGADTSDPNDGSTGAIDSGLVDGGSTDDGGSFDSGSVDGGSFDTGLLDGGAFDAAPEPDDASQGGGGTDSGTSVDAGSPIPGPTPVPVPDAD
jgi:hypothetical protein